VAAVLSYAIFLIKFRNSAFSRDTSLQFNPIQIIDGSNGDNGDHGSPPTGPIIGHGDEWTTLVPNEAQLHNRPCSVVTESTQKQIV